MVDSWTEQSHRAAISLDDLEALLARLSAAFAAHPHTLVMDRNTYDILRKHLTAYIGVKVLGKRVRFRRSRWKVVNA